MMRMHIPLNGLVLLMMLHLTGALTLTPQCNTTEQCPSQCQCATHFNSRSNYTFLHVNCTSAGLSGMPHFMPCQDSDIRYHIFLNRNHIHTVVYNTYLHNTIYLNMGDNILNNVTPEAIAAMTNIQQLYLHNNKLTSLPEAMRNLTKLSEISLYKNPWDCNCDKTWFIEWTRKSENVLSNGSQIKCSTPKYLRNNELLVITEAQMQCKDKKDQKFLAPYVIAIIIIVLLYLIISSITAIFITIRRRQKTEIINQGESSTKSTVFKVCTQTVTLQ